MPEHNHLATVHSSQCTPQPLTLHLMAICTREVTEKHKNVKMCHSKLRKRQWFTWRLKQNRSSISQLCGHLHNSLEAEKVKQWRTAIKGHHGRQAGRQKCHLVNKHQEKGVKHNHPTQQSRNLGHTYPPPCLRKLLEEANSSLQKAGAIEWLPRKCPLAQRCRHWQRKAGWSTIKRQGCWGLGRGTLVLCNSCLSGHKTLVCGIYKHYQLLLWLISSFWPSPHWTLP